MWEASVKRRNAFVSWPDVRVWQGSNRRTHARMFVFICSHLVQTPTAGPAASEFGTCVSVC